MKKKLKLNKKTIAELNDAAKVTGGNATGVKCGLSWAQPCVTIPCGITQDKNCYTLNKYGCHTDICISDVECATNDLKCQI